MPTKRFMKRHSVTQPSDSSYRLIPLTQGQNAIVDANDFDWLSRWNWHARKKKSNGKFYAGRTECEGSKKRLVAMHVAILGVEADHISRNTLDNRRQNLRPCTNSQNSKNRDLNRNNTSGFKGVYWHTKRRRWMAQICANGRQVDLGRFGTKEEAARAYNEAANKLHGDFASPNVLGLRY